MDGFWAAFTAWLAKGQLGVIPEWFNGLSLLLALYLFLRSRRTDDRALVDRVGIWLTTEYERQAPDVGAADRIEEGKFTLHARNASDVPVEVHQVAFRIASEWAVEDRAPSSDGFGVWTIRPGVDQSRHFAEWFLLAPDERKDVVDGQLVNVAHHAPERATALHLFGGITARVDWFLVVDNAGRRWEVRPGRGRQARRIHWYSLRREFYPPDWQNWPFKLVARWYFLAREAVRRRQRARRDDRAQKASSPG